MLARQCRTIQTQTELCDARASLAPYNATRLDHSQDKTQYRALQCETTHNRGSYNARRSQMAVNANPERCNARQHALQGRTMQYKTKCRAIQCKTVSNSGQHKYRTLQCETRNTGPYNAIQNQIQSDTMQDGLKRRSTQIRSAAM